MLVQEYLKKLKNIWEGKTFIEPTLKYPSDRPVDGPD